MFDLVRLVTRNAILTAYFPRFYPEQVTGTPIRLPVLFLPTISLDFLTAANLFFRKIVPGKKVEKL